MKKFIIFVTEYMASENERKGAFWTDVKSVVVVTILYAYFVG